MTALVLGVLNSGEDLHIINKTNKFFIPKKNKPLTPKDFHPISLCHVVYKFIAKVLVNRMKPAFIEIVGLSQNAIVTGRAIFVNATMAHELLRSMKNRRKWNMGF